jgi:ankyrin repeat protein
MGNVFCSYILRNSITHLREAIETSNIKQIEEILEKNPTIINMPCDRHGNTPLMIAIEHVQLNACKILLECGANPNQENKQTHLTPLHLACSLRTSKPSQKNANDMQTSVNENVHGPVGQLSSSQAILNKTQISDNSNSASSPDKIKELISMLCKYGGDINKVTCAEKLNDNGIITTLPVTPLMFAIDRRNQPAIDTLIKEGVDINYQEPTSFICALHLACGIGNAGLIVQLLENGANPFLKVSLHTHSKISILGLKWLKSFLKSKHNTSTLHWLALNHKDDTGGLLALMRFTNNILDLNIANENDQTPIMLAAMKNKQNMVKTLLDNDASLDLKDRNGMTALDYAKGNSCYTLIASFNRIRKISIKKHLSKMSLHEKKSTKTLNVSTMSLPNPRHSMDISQNSETLEMVEEDFAKIVVDDNYELSEKEQTV